MKKMKEELKSLKEKMLAIQNGNLDVEAQNPRIVKCWERLNCRRKDCVAYGKLRCWSIAGTYCRGKVQGDFAQKLGDCRECVVYKESCGDEIGELIEVFNQMVKDIKFTSHVREQSSREMARSERLKEIGNMVAAVAHETRNPLHSIGIATSYLKKNFHGELMTEFLAIIEEEVRRLNDLTTLFISFSHPAPLDLEPCDLNIIAESAVALCRSEAESKKIAILIRWDDTLVPVRCDSVRIREAVCNLIVNAVDASREGDAITVETTVENSMVRISVQDSGSGISQEEREKIFRPFYTTKSRGPGLGLAIVERSIKEHNGRIEFNSTPGQGSTFSMLLPFSPEE